MVQIIGRLTGDAVVKTVGDREVVNFTIAINDWYKPKGANEGVEQVTYIQCGYWFNTSSAATLKRGAIVEAGGRLFPTAYMKDNEPQGRINMQAQHIKVHAFAKKNEPHEEPREQSQLFDEQQQANGDIGSSAKPNKSKSKKQKQEQVVTENKDGLPF